MTLELKESPPESYIDYVEFNKPGEKITIRRTIELGISNSVDSEKKTNVIFYFTNSLGEKYKFKYLDTLTKQFNYKSSVGSYFNMMIVNLFVTFEQNGKTWRTKEFFAKAGNYGKSFEVFVYQCGTQECAECFIDEDRITVTQD